MDGMPLRKEREKKQIKLHGEQQQHKQRVRLLLGFFVFKFFRAQDTHKHMCAATHIWPARIDRSIELLCSPLFSRHVCQQEQGEGIRHEEK